MAAGVRVGNALGAGNSTAAKRTIKVAISLVGNYIPNMLFIYIVHIPG